MHHQALQIGPNSEPLTMGNGSLSNLCTPSSPCAVGLEERHVSDPGLRVCRFCPCFRGHGQWPVMCSVQQPDTKGSPRGAHDPSWPGRSTPAPRRILHGKQSKWFRRSGHFGSCAKTLLRPSHPLPESCMRARHAMKPPSGLHKQAHPTRTCPACRAQWPWTRGGEEGRSMWREMWTACARDLSTTIAVTCSVFWHPTHVDKSHGWRVQTTVNPA